MTSTSVLSSDNQIIRKPDRLAILACVILVLIAAAVRLPQLGRAGYVLDELWSLEIASGRGSVHLNLPIGKVVAPPPIFSLSDAPPWWKIWTRMEVTHPPLYSILLRWWEDLFGDTDYGGRLFSVIASLVAVALLFDTVRLQCRTDPAFWAGLFMALAAPQVEHARLARSYTLLETAALLAANALVRIERFGLSKRRFAVFGTGLLATLLVHYFCIGAMLGLGFYVLVYHREKLRRWLLAAMATAAIVFTIAWGPFMWRQRTLFTTDDPSTQFLTNGESGHVWRTLLRLALEPSNLLYPSPEKMARFATIGAVLFVIPFLPRTNRSALRLWGLWLAGTTAAVAAMDLARGTLHLYYMRYTLLAGPAVYALLAMMLTLGHRRWLGHLCCGVVVLGLLVGLPDVYAIASDQPQKIVAEMNPPPDGRDLLIFSDATNGLTELGGSYLLMARYLAPMQSRVAFLQAPAGPEVMRAAAESRCVYLICHNQDDLRFLPGAQLLGGRMYIKRGLVFTLKMPTAH